MMLGIPASNSMATTKGRRSMRGLSSVMNMAMPKLSGTPMAMAMNEVTNVP